MTRYTWFTQHDNGIDPLYVDKHVVGPHDLARLKDIIWNKVNNGDAGDGWIMEYGRLVWRMSDYWNWEDTGTTDRIDRHEMMDNGIEYDAAGALWN